MTEPVDLDALQAAARNAQTKVDPIAWYTADAEGYPIDGPEDARFIATADPSTVLALIGELRDARASAVRDKKDIAYLMRRSEEWWEACQSQGLPDDCTVEMFVRHHRSNAGLAAFSEALAHGIFGGVHREGFCRGCAYNHEALQPYDLTPNEMYAITTVAHELGIAAQADLPPITGFLEEAKSAADLRAEVLLARAVIDATRPDPTISRSERWNRTVAALAAFDAATQSNPVE